MATTIFITGAARGLGRALTETYLSRPNHTVIASVRTLESPNADSLKAVPTAEGSSLILVKIESTVVSDAEAAVKAIQAKGVDHLDVVIANAGISNVFARIEDIELKDLRKMFDVNTCGPLALYKATYPLLKKTADSKGPGTPKFVAITTFAASAQNLESNTPFLLGSYGASKTALNYIVRRAQFETEWLTAFVCDPGFIQSDMGNEGARFFGMEKATVPLDISAAGIMKHIDEATREKTSGAFLSYDGTELPY